MTVIVSFQSKQLSFHCNSSHNHPVHWFGMLLKCKITSETNINKFEKYLQILVMYTTQVMEHNGMGIKELSRTQDHPQAFKEESSVTFNLGSCLTRRSLAFLLH